MSTSTLPFMKNLLFLVCTTAVSFAAGLHETISTLYGGQFFELFAYTLQNCLCKLASKLALFDVLNLLFDICFNKCFHRAGNAASDHDQQLFEDDFRFFRHPFVDPVDQQAIEHMPIEIDDEFMILFR